MTTIEIKHRFTDAVLFIYEVPPDVAALSGAWQLGYAVRAALKARADLARADLARAYLADADLADAYLAGANLAGANLAGADLAGAYLAGANLARANLARANLARAYLADADLAGAYLAGAYLAGADLARANLAGAYLARANLAGADLAGADLARADLADAYLAGAYLAGANLADAKNVLETNGSESIQEAPTDRAERYAKRAAKFRERNPDVPVIPDIDARLLGILERREGVLNMGSWHTCKTTHCMAGWAVTLAGDAGKTLEDQYGPFRAGHMIYTASIGRAPHFFASNERAMEDLKARAAEQAAP